MLRILLVSVEYTPSLSSTARLYSELAEDLSSAGHRVTVLTPIPDRYLAEDTKIEVDGWIHEEERDGIHVVRVRKVPVPQHVPVARAAERVALGISFWLAGRRLSPHDVVIVYSPPLPVVRAAQMLGKRWGASVIVNVQDIYPQTVIDLKLLTNPLLIRLAERLESRIYREANLLTVHSEGNRDYLMREKDLNGAHLEVVHNWVDLETTSPGPRVNAWRKRYELPEEKFVVSFAGAMGFAQGLSDILLAADQLRHRENLLFLMVGDGAFRKDLVELREHLGLPNLRFLPPQPAHDYVDLLRASDVSLVPLNAGLATPVVPGKLQSIMAAGRPVIQYSDPASDGRRIIEQARCGIFVEARDPKGLSSAIARLHDNPDLAREMGDRGRAYAINHFDRKSSTDKYLDFIKELTT